MKTFFVMFDNHYIQAVTAESFEVIGDNLWFGDNGSDVVAFFPRNLVISIVEEEAHSGFFPAEYQEEEPEDGCEESCLDCRLEEFLDSEEFGDKVNELIGEYLMAPDGVAEESNG